MQNSSPEQDSNSEGKAAIAARPLRHRKRRLRLTAVYPRPSGHKRPAGEAFSILPAAAQTVVTLRTNVNEGTATVIIPNDDLVAQTFTTGSNKAGYTVTSVDIVSADSDDDSFTASIWTTDASGYPDTAHATLTAPSSFAAGTLAFSAPANTTLAPNTTYTVRIAPGANSVTFGSALSNFDNGRSGWSIGNAHHRRPSGGSWQAPSNSSLRIAIKGYANPNPPDAPTGLTATEGHHAVRLDWTAPADNGSAITGYVIGDYIRKSQLRLTPRGLRSPSWAVARPS